MLLKNLEKLKFLHIIIDPHPSLPRAGEGASHIPSPP